MKKLLMITAFITATILFSGCAGTMQDISKFTDGLEKKSWVKGETVSEIVNIIKFTDELKQSEYLDILKSRYLESNELKGFVANAKAKGNLVRLYTGDFNETVAQFTVDDALERLNAVVQTVEEQIIAPGIERHGMQNAVRDRVAAREQRLIRRHIGVDGNAGLVHPVLEFRERNIIVGADALKARRLLFLGNAGADIDNGRAGIALAQQHGVRLHR